MMSYWDGILTILLGALSAFGGAFLWSKLKKKPKTSVPSKTLEELKTIEADYKITIAEKQCQIDALKLNLGAHIDVIRELEAQIEDHRNALAKAYEASGLTAEEIAEAFKGLKL